MNLIDLKREIIEKSIRHLYVFHGVERGVMRVYLEKMSNELSLPIQRMDSIEEVLPKLSNDNLFGDEIGFYVVYNDKQIQKDEKLLEKMSNEVGENYVVLLYDELDSRTKFAKMSNEFSVEFQKMSNEIYRRYTRELLEAPSEKLSENSEFSDNSENCQNIQTIHYNNAFVDKIASIGNYDRIVLEVDKIHTIQKITKDENILNSVICVNNESNIYDIVDMIIRRNPSVYRSIESVEAIPLLSLLYNQIKNIMLVQLASGNASEITGLSSQQCFFASKYKGLYKAENLVKIFNNIRLYIEEIKQGKIPPESAKRIIINKILASS